MDLAKILLVDDHTIFRQAMVRMLSAQEGLVVIGDLDSMEVARDRFDELATDVLIVAYELHDGSGLELVKQLKASDSKKKAIVLLSSDGHYPLIYAVQAGADGCVSKSESFEQMLFVLRSVLTAEYM